MKSLLKDVILICKGYYNKDKYLSVKDALVAYYKKNYSDDYDVTDEFLLNTLIRSAMIELCEKYPDRLLMIMDGYIMKAGDADSYSSQLLSAIILAFHDLCMRGPNLIDIDTSIYFTIIDGERVPIHKII